MFDWIPTIDEVIDFWDCRIMGHKWGKRDDGVVQCMQCGKVRKA